ncbi:AraC family transcriptional regulator [Sinorhizobium sp. 7-81]|uniref:helix-turn-helix domain-containing protein n=1 Tax=Sinorhizobium sp. 8-89 TaxID=3049089 RepID=UPI0024C3D571|nr:AraC family transcriptional regulator [Sinorhizobium sp. 8-89]MDK1491882.1 AraC family transcriptional regulator [Sinorhizobium sp. 8-89]
MAPWQVKRLKLHIENSISRPIALHELAALSRLSTSRFSAAFKISFGLPPHAYLIERRVAFAKTRMLTSDAPLCEIALDCGLADQAHLSRVFRRVTGTPPSVWRRSRREASGDGGGRIIPNSVEAGSSEYLSLAQHGIKPKSAGMPEESGAPPDRSWR